MKKIAYIFAVFTILPVCLCFGCKQSVNLSDFIYQLQTDVFEGSSQNYSLKANYGYVSDGEKIYSLTVKIIGEVQENATYSIAIEHGGKTYNEDFELNPVSGVMTAKLEIENLTEKSFEVTITTSSQSEKITLNSVVPTQTADYKTAINSLLKSQPNLVENYYDGETFNGKIVMKILVKNDKPYWYVGLINSSENTKALLIDGITLKVLAIRDIF